MEKKRADLKLLRIEFNNVLYHIYIILNASRKHIINMIFI